MSDEMLLSNILVLQSLDTLSSLLASSLQCIASSRELGKDALPQPSRLSITRAPHFLLLFLFLFPFVPQTAVSHSPGLPALQWKAHERPRHQRAVHTSLHHASILSGQAAQSGALSTGQAAVVYPFTLPSGQETLPLTFAFSPIYHFTVIIVVVAFGKETPEWN